MLAVDEYENGSVKKKNSGPWIHVKKAN